MFTDYTPIEEVGKREKEFYAEYEFVESVEEKVTTISMDVTKTTEVPGEVNSVYAIYKDVDFGTSGIFSDLEIKRVAVLINQDVLRDVVTTLYQNSSMLYGGPVQTFIDNALIQSGVISSNNSVDTVIASNTLELGNVSVTDNIDDYLSDRKLHKEDYLVNTEDFFIL